jgi:hypothetical protein
VPPPRELAIRFLIAHPDARAIPLAMNPLPRRYCRFFFLQS